jgi:ABC-type glycerol-3-phosphate transport system substrate-binding protein
MNRLKRVAIASISLIVVLAFCIGASAQEKKITKKDVPQAVISAFEKAYPKAKVKGYSTETEEGKTYFEVESTVGKMTLDISYLADGTAAEIEEGVAARELPDAVKVAVKTDYPKGKITKAEKKTVGTTVTYELKVTTGKTSAGVEIDPSGKIMRKSKEGAEKDEKEEKEEKR